MIGTWCRPALKHFLCTPVNHVTGAHFKPCEHPKYTVRVWVSIKVVQRERMVGFGQSEIEFRHVLGYAMDGLLVCLI